MIRLDKNVSIKPAAQKQPAPSTTEQPSPVSPQPGKPRSNNFVRPDVVNAKVYKLKSAFVKNSVFITLGYVKSNDGISPVEIFINSKDLTKAPEYVVLTRLISAIFRRATNPMFILEELQGIFDPNGGSFKEGKYYHSFYAEISDIIERFFVDVGIVQKQDISELHEKLEKSSDVALDEVGTQINLDGMNENFRICPDCQSKALKTENGCDSCMSCGYSKCDK